MDKFTSSMIGFLKNGHTISEFLQDHHDHPEHYYTEDELEKLTSIQEKMSTVDGRKEIASAWAEADFAIWKQKKENPTLDSLQKEIVELKNRIKFLEEK